MPSPVPNIRIRTANNARERSDADYVLYWMNASRRTHANFGLQRAHNHAQRLGLPLLVFEGLRVDYPYASLRHHTFIAQGMRDNAARLQGAGVTVHSWLERQPGEGKGLLAALASRAAVVVTDLYPTFFLPRMIEAAAAKLDVRLEVVDSCGLVPLDMPQRDFTVAHSFRRWIQKNVGPMLEHFPDADPLEGYDLGSAEIPAEVTERWPAVDWSKGAPTVLSELPVPSEPGPIREIGGSVAGWQAWTSFIDGKLARYHDDRNDPDARVQSYLSPYLHYGHVGPHQLLVDLFERENWTPDQLSKPNGKRDGFWNLSPGATAFLDELITWRELGYVFCHRTAEPDALDGLPPWAVQTLQQHSGDERPSVYTLGQFERAETHDELWNAAQRQLLAEGRIHNYLRMLWGKKILHWSASPADALEIMLHLNETYAIDGRDPNSLSGIFWVLGRFDRAWGPEREVFGKVRYMTSASARRKLDLTGYLERWGPR